MKIITNRIVLFGFVLRIIVAFWNGFWGPSFGAEGDAASFHYWASEYAHDPTFFVGKDFGIGWIYAKVLGIVYFMTVGSLFLGSVLSCIAWFISAQILYNCLQIISVDRDVRNKIMLLYSFLPSSIMYTAVTLREPYQLLFVNLALYAFLKIYYDKVTSYWITLCATLYCLALLHGVLIYFAIFFFAGALIIVNSSKKEIMQTDFIKVVFLIPIIAIGLWYSLSVFGNNAYDVSNGYASAVETHQQGALSTVARTNYKSSAQLSSPSSAIFFVPISLFQYLFEPLPWHISSVVDIIMLIENIVRCWLIWNIFKILRYTSLSRRKIMFFTSFYYFLLEMIWAIGTVNWGTASRHHIPALGLLLISAYSFRRQVRLT